MTWFDDYNKFADACEIPKGDLLDRPNVDALRLGKSLVEEEYNETTVAYQNYVANPSLENLVEFADGLGDTIYVLCQWARAAGIPLNAVWDAIQTANMTKVGPDGKVTRREDGKILKPIDFVPPDTIIWEKLKEEQDRLARERKVLGAENWNKE